MTPVASCAGAVSRSWGGYEEQGTIRAATGGDPSDAQLWAQVQDLTVTYNGQPDYAYGKVGWRMTEHGDFHVRAFGPHGEQLAPKEGPIAHGGSTEDTHPGDEWGTMMTFSSAGCWDLHAWRDDVSGDVTLLLK